MIQSQRFLSAMCVALCIVMGVMIAPGVASAQDIHAQPRPMQPPSSPIHGVFTLGFGSYKPHIDNEFSGSGGPYSTLFGDGGGLRTEFTFAWHLYQGVGKVSIGGSLGIFNKKGDAYTVSGEKSADRTSLLIVPLRLSAIYRFDYLQTEFNIPLVISVNAGLDYSFWRVKNAGKTADGATPGGNVLVGRGGTWGWHYGVKLSLWLNALAPSMAAIFDSTTGINNSYLFAQFLSTHVDNFGSSSSWDLSDNFFMFGIAFEF